MNVILFFILITVLQSCTSKKYTVIRQLPKGIKSAIEERYVILNDRKELLQKKEMIFTGNGRIRYSRTVDASGNLMQETHKKLWFITESYPDKEKYYCKTRWKPGQRERISCYTQKQYKQNEAVYYYNTDGTIAKIVDNFTTFHTQYYYYTDNGLSKIVTKDQNDRMVDELLISCISKDERGTCLKESRVSDATGRKEEWHFVPVYE
ncbi:hypothetical protein NAT51_05135 [Flavobacterium amniphilum]|uniref:hypothetical protein n=1 Tax=Flavobacterium amniphilum TaxID=1834035 RepID=UPI00202AB796|nr:hypothetical protein [Flavobacterium amniphilum]MCL9804892.1 hypothetical protein [Flavobacterium amniphilum]